MHSFMQEKISLQNITKFSFKIFLQSNKVGGISKKYLNQQKMYVSSISRNLFTFSHVYLS